MSDKPYAIGRDFNFERFLARVIELNRRPLDEATRKVEMSKLCLDMARTDAERRGAWQVRQVTYPLSLLGGWQAPQQGELG